MENFLWHKVSEQEKGKIKKQAMTLMNNFADSIEKIKPEKKQETKEENFREEIKENKPDSEFRNLMMQNAPKIKNDCIEAERAEW